MAIRRSLMLLQLTPDVQKGKICNAILPTYPTIIISNGCAPYLESHCAISSQSLCMMVANTRLLHTDGVPIAKAISESVIQ
jgi:hypothetical protein